MTMFAIDTISAIPDQAFHYLQSVVSLASIPGNEAFRAIAVMVGVALFAAAVADWLRSLFETRSPVARLNDFAVDVCLAAFALALEPLAERLFAGSDFVTPYHQSELWLVAVPM